jgi:energy-coupling factor transporter ATP-binding protein EcfA2
MTVRLPRTVEVFGRSLRVERGRGTPDPAAMSLLAALPSTDRDADSVVSIVDGPDAAGHLAWQLSAAAATSVTHLVVHAGGVMHEEGALLLVGPSGAGKSTLTAAMVQAGAGYLSDELVGIRMSGDVVDGHARPISLDGPARIHLGLDDRGGEQKSPVDLGAAQVIRSAPVRAVVFVARDAGAPAALEPLSAGLGTALAALHCLNLDVLGTSGFERLARLVAGVPCYRLSVTDTAAAVRSLRALPPRPVPVAATRVGTDPAAVQLDGEVVVWAGEDRVHHLNASAALVWTSVRDGLASDELARRIGGDPAEVEATVAHLRGLGLL